MYSLCIAITAKVLKFSNPLDAVTLRKITAREMLAVGNPHKNHLFRFPLPQGQSICRDWENPFPVSSSKSLKSRDAIKPAREKRARTMIVLYCNKFHGLYPQHLIYIIIQNSFPIEKKFRLIHLTPIWTTIATTVLFSFFSTQDPKYRRYRLR